MIHTEAGPAVTRQIDGAELPAPGRWQLDPGHTELAFIGRHFMLTKVRGRFMCLERSSFLSGRAARWQGIRGMLA
jgi:polyisoprenoid-binding protein YceI